MVNTSKSFVHHSLVSKNVSFKQKRLSGHFLKILSNSGSSTQKSRNGSPTIKQSIKLGDSDLCKAYKVLSNKRINNARQNWIPRNKELLKEWEFLIKPDNFYSCCVSTTINVNAIKEIKESLSPAQINMFADTCFGHFLQLDNIVVQPQVLHALLLREVNQYNEQEMWFNICGCRVKFGIKEFTLVTGLQCGGHFGDFDTSTQPLRLKIKYFGGLDKVTKLSVRGCFINRHWDCDEDAVKIAFLYFLHLFLLPNLPNNHIPDKHFYIVDSEMCNVYPWGKESFDYTLNSMKEKYTGKSHRGGYIHHGFPSKCSLLGCPIALQIWFYECCGAMDGKFANRIATKIPRILNWRSSRKPHMKELQRHIFSLSPDLLKLKNITPTHVERQQLHHGDLFDMGESIYIGAGHNFHPDFDDFQSVRRAPNERNNDDANCDEVSLLGVPTNDEFMLLKGSVLDMANEIKGLRNEVGSLKSSIDQYMTEIIHQLQCLRKSKDEKVLDESAREETLNPKDEDDVEIVQAKKNGVQGDEGPSLVQQKYESVSEEEGCIKFTQSFQEESPDDILYNMSPNELDELEDSAYKSLEISKNPATLKSSVPVIFHLDDCPSFDILSTPCEEKHDARPLFDVTPQSVSCFGSSSSCDKVILKSKAVKGLCPLESLNGFDINDPLVLDFGRWLLKGVNKLRRGKIYLRSHDMIGICLDFSVELIQEKIWLYDLCTQGRSITESHVNVLFYYLRKKVKYGNCSEVRCTTTTPLFDQQLQSLYVKYMSSGCDLLILKKDQDLLPNILGYFMDFPTSWVAVDHVLFPIYLGKKRNHWILARLSFSDRKIFLYNSFKIQSLSREARSTLSAYCDLLPYFVQLAGFYEIRTDIDLHSVPYVGTSNLDPYIVVEIQSLPLQDNTDSGIFMSAFAEHFIESLDIPSELSVELHRKRFAFLLYQHGLRKAQEYIESDIEN